RKERPGVMFNDMELLGVPFTLVIGERNLDENKVELKNRQTGEKLILDLDTAVQTIKAALNA
ncbi:His/Gly/Thr/Pro-type tRNA ligase C-terminal domain-containing protein, partial [Enterococcus faecium]|uniref:His/Gly/Thr/Pro-type tRNA ligase C-terminal domain-containing protein n=2 Tax=Bacteria TaxID=2 RepID=UPI0034E95082